MIRLRGRAGSRRLVLLLVALVGVVASACTSGPSTTGSSGATAKTIRSPDADLIGTPGTTPEGHRVVKLGALVSQTGPGAPYGASQLRGLELAVRQLNDRKTIPGVQFELVVRDDGSDAAKAKVALNELIDQQQIVALFGPTLSSVAAEVDRIAVAAGVPVLAISNTTLDLLTIGDPTWRVALTDPALAQSNLELARERFGVHTVGLVWDPSDRRSRDLADRFRQAASAAGVEVRGDVPFKGGTADLVPTIEQAQDLHVDALMIASTDDDARRLFAAIAQGTTSLDFNALGNSVWRVALSERTVIPKAVAVAHDRAGVSRSVLVFDPADPYSSGAADAFRTAAAQSGVTIVREVTYTSGTRPDFTPALATVSSGDANGFFVAALSAEAEQFLNQRSAARLTSTPLVGGDGFFDDALIAREAIDADGLIIGAAWLAGADSSNERSAAFVQDFTTQYGSTPDQWAALGFAGVELVTSAMQLQHGAATRAAIRTGLIELRDVPTVLGSVTFSDVREAQYPGLVVTPKNGVFVPFATADP